MTNFAQQQAQLKLAVVDRTSIETANKSPQAAKPIRVLIADDDHYSRCGMRYILDAAMRFEIVVAPQRSDATERHAVNAQAPPARQGLWVVGRERSKLANGLLDVFIDGANVTARGADAPQALPRNRRVGSQPHPP